VNANHHSDTAEWWMVLLTKCPDPSVPASGLQKNLRRAPDFWPRANSTWQRPPLRSCIQSACLH